MPPQTPIHLREREKPNGEKGGKGFIPPRPLTISPAPFLFPPNKSSPVAIVVVAYGKSVLYEQALIDGFKQTPIDGFYFHS
jgi:hypothetical protein